MTEIDTSRDAEVHADFFDPSRGYCVLFSTYTALLDRAEKAEAERDRWQRAVCEAAAIAKICHRTACEQMEDDPDCIRHAERAETAESIHAAIVDIMMQESRAATEGADDDRG
jgi:hypothetical protein